MGVSENSQALCFEGKTPCDLSPHATAAYDWLILLSLIREQQAGLSLIF
jgi:hypothetical protein